MVGIMRAESQRKPLRRGASCIHMEIKMHSWRCTGAKIDIVAFHTMPKHVGDIYIRRESALCRYQVMSIESDNVRNGSTCWIIYLNVQLREIGYFSRAKIPRVVDESFRS